MSLAEPEGLVVRVVLERAIDVTKTNYREYWKGTISMLTSFFILEYSFVRGSLKERVVCIRSWNIMLKRSNLSS